MIDGATPMRASVNANVLAASCDRDVARADEAQAAGADVPVDRTDDGQRQPEDASQQVRQFAGAVDGQVPGISSSGLGEIRSGAERSAGVVEYDGPHPGLLGGVGEPLL